MEQFAGAVSPSKSVQQTPENFIYVDSSNDVPPPNTAAATKLKEIEIEHEDDSRAGIDDFDLEPTETPMWKVIRELGTSKFIDADIAAKITGSFLSSDGNYQMEGDNFYERIAHDMVLDFASDGNVVVFHSDTLTAALSLRNDLNAKRKDPPATVRLYGYTRTLPLNRDSETYRNILRTAICSNAYLDFKVMPHELPLQNLTVPVRFKALVFIVPSQTTASGNSDHFAAIVYYHSAKRDGRVSLYFYDSLVNRNIKNAIEVAELLSEIRFFNDSGKYVLNKVFPDRESFQEARECSSFSLFFAERTREAALKGYYEPLLMRDYAYRDGTVCAVSLLRQTGELIEAERQWWESNVSRESLLKGIKDFVERRIEFADGNRAVRSALLTTAVGSVLLHDVPVPGDRSQKWMFSNADTEDMVNLNADLVRLYMLTSLVLPDDVMFSTSIAQLKIRWERALEVYRELIKSKRRGDPNVNAAKFAASLPRLMIWLYLPDEDASARPVGLRAPVLVVARPHFTMGVPQAAARVSYINVYTTVKVKGVDQKQLGAAVGRDLLGDIFYANINNYAEDPSNNQEPDDDARFMAWYSTWRYGMIDVLRNLAKNEGYFDYYESDETAASWARTFASDIPGVRAEWLQRERKEYDHRRARMHLRGKLLQLLSTDAYIKPASANKSSLLFNSRDALGKVDLDRDYWRYSDVRPRVPHGASLEDDDVPFTSLARRSWPFFYYNLTFGAALDCCVQQQLGTPGWRVLSVPCALETGNPPTVAVLDSWHNVTTSSANPGPTVPMPVLICGTRLGSQDAQPCVFGLLDVVRLFSSKIYGQMWRQFFTAHNAGSFVEHRRRHEAFGICGAPFTGDQDPYTRVMVKGFTAELSRKTNEVISSVKLDSPSINPAEIRTLTKLAENHSASHVISIACAFFISKALGR